MPIKHFDWLSHHASMTPNAPCWTDLHSGRAFDFAAAEGVREAIAHLLVDRRETRGATRPYVEISVIYRPNLDDDFMGVVLDSGS